ncbi:MAG: ABC-F family ATP-binding cassette domain-containing protein [Spirochaetota bacterium]
MTLVEAQSLSLTYTATPILRDVDIRVSAGDRLALAGANGSGKSTLMRILAGEIEADSGTIRRFPGVGVSYLPQEGIRHGERAVWEEAEKAFSHVAELIERRDHVAGIMEKDPESEDLDDLLAEYQSLQDRIEESEYYVREGRIHAVLRGLGFGEADFDRPGGEFSGGWQMRIALARVLLESPDCLLLDEPTNYLDLEARTWLSGYLRRYRGGFIIVAHDRAFLDETVSAVAELFNGRLRVYRGSYTSYEQRRHAEIEQLVKDYEAQQQEIQRLERFIERFRYNASKASLVQSRIKELERIERIELPEHLKRVGIRFPDAPHSGRQVIVTEGLTKSYASEPVLSDVDLTVERGEKLVVVGRNGAGKSTLLKILAGKVEADAGSVAYGTGVTVASYFQDRVDADVRDVTVLEDAQSVAPTQMVPALRDMLGAFLFSGDDVHKSRRVLSGGERSRLELVKLLMRPANLLILDEPTNHLDLTSKDVLRRALEQYDGTVVFVSHDSDFTQHIATRILELIPEREGAPSAVRNFPGDYDYYLWKVRQENEPPAGAGERTEPVRRPAGGSGSPESHTEQSHAEQKRRRQRRERLSRREAEVLSKLEEEESAQAERESRLSHPAVYADGEEVRRLTREINEGRKRLSDLTAEWEEIEAELAELAE